MSTGRRIPTQAIILVGGEGTRLRPVTSRVPKHVAVEHVEAAVVELVGAVCHGPRRAEGFCLDGVVDLQTVAGTVADLRLDGRGEEARGEDGALHAVPREIVEDVGDERALDDRGDGLRHARRDGA